MRSKQLGLVVGIVVLLLAGFVFFRLEKSTRPPDTASEGGPAVPTIRPNPPGPGSAPIRTPDRPSGANLAEAGDAAAPTEGNPGGERPSVGDILAEPDEDFLRVSKKLAALVADPRVPMEEREEALAHTLNLSIDHEKEVLDPLVKDQNVPDALAETILSEALNRSLSYQADLYLAALAVRKSPEMQKLIREHLAFLINGEDLGPDPAAWRGPLAEARKEWTD